MFGFSPTCVDAFGEYALEYGIGNAPTADQIAAAIFAQAAITPLPVDAQYLNGSRVYGSGVSSDKWRGTP